ncbi:MAG: hypothetical protein DWQ01_14585 [Planctomycetota bacterium]|nr:MAG: hypothetical protein DWQ01_14585 [Planctomycetota bacterium]
MSGFRHIPHFLLGFFALALVDAFLIPEDVPLGGGLATLMTFALGIGLALIAGLARPIYEWLLPKDRRRQPEAMFALGLSLALAAQVGLFLPQPWNTRVAINWKLAMPLAASMTLLFYVLCGRTLTRLPFPKRPWLWTLALFFTSAALVEARDQWKVASRVNSLAPLPPGEPATATQKPNVILVVLDTLRAEGLGGSWNQETPMPWFEDFAGQGRRFSRGYSASNFTPPGHASLFTGLYPAGNGTLNRGEVILEESQLTLAEFLRRYGYRTLGVTSNWRLGKEQGFGQGHEIFDDALVRKEDVRGLALRRFSSSRLFRAWTGNNIRGGTKMLLKNWLPPPQYKLTALGTSARVAELLDSMKLKEDEPLFLFVNFIDPHLPFQTEAGLAAEFGPNHEDAELEELRMDGLGFHRTLKNFSRILEAGDPNNEVGPRLAWVEEAYWEQCRQLDLGLKAFFEDLEARGRLKDSLILVTSDHGEHLGEHTLFLHGNSLFEELVRVPFWLFGSGIEAGRDPHPVSGVDFFPTVCRALGVDPPAKLDGLPLQDPIPEGRPVLFESGTNRGYLQGNHKWIAQDLGDQFQWTHVFDLGQDPKEQKNLLDSGLDWVVNGMKKPPMEPSREASLVRQVEDPNQMAQLGYADETEEEEEP